MTPQRFRLFWLATLTAHATIAVAWWWLMPGGFSPSSKHFWMNQVLPWAVLAISVIARATMAKRPTLSQAILSAFAPLWSAAAISSRILFPSSFRLLFAVPLLIGGCLLLALLATCGKLIFRNRVAWCVAVFAAVIGAWIPWSQRSESASTIPSPPLGQTTSPEWQPASSKMLKLNDAVQIQPGDALVSVYAGRHVLGVQPLLTFTSRSPDRCWSLFAPRGLRDEPNRRLLNEYRLAPFAGFSYADDENSMLTVSAERIDVLELNAISSLAEPIYSHLNTFCELTLTGHRALAVSFSPCNDSKIDVLPMDYPRGRPARFAYLDASGNFHVAEARSAEKGPFHDLTSGKLDRGDPLEMTFYDRGIPIFKVSLRDWSAQASTAASPTAGWGVLVNAIEFSLQGDSASSAAGVFITLAATSVGRGYDSVGHAAGMYRNRMRIERLQSATTQPAQ